MLFVCSAESKTRVCFVFATRRVPLVALLYYFLLYLLIHPTRDK